MYRISNMNGQRSSSNQTRKKGKSMGPLPMSQFGYRSKSNKSKQSLNLTIPRVARNSLNDTIPGVDTSATDDVYANHSPYDMIQKDIIPKYGRGGPAIAIAPDTISVSSIGSRSSGKTRKRSSTSSSSRGSRTSSSSRGSRTSSSSRGSSGIIPVQLMPRPPMDQIRTAPVSVAEPMNQPRTAPMKGKSTVMSEAFVMKSYYYPSDDSPNSINGTLVIDFNVDKKQKMSQTGGAPFGRYCSDPRTGYTRNAPLQTMAAIYDCLGLSAAIEFVTTAEDNLIDAAVALVDAAPGADAALAAALAAINALNPARGAVPGVAAPLDPGVDRDAALAATDAALAAPAAAARNAALAAAARNAAAPGAAAAAAAAVIRNIEFNAANDQLVYARDMLREIKINFGEVILGIVPIGHGARRPGGAHEANCTAAADAANITSVIWNTFTTNIFQWIGTNARNKLIDFEFDETTGGHLIKITINELPAIPAPFERMPGTNCWRIKKLLGAYVRSHFTFHRSNPNYDAATAQVISSRPPPPPGPGPGPPPRGFAAAVHVQRNQNPKLEIGSEWALCAKFDCALGYAASLIDANVTYEIVNPASNVLVKNLILMPGIRFGVDPQVTFFEIFLKKIGQELILVSKTPILAVALVAPVPAAARGAARAAAAGAARAAALLAAAAVAPTPLINILTLDRTLKTSDLFKYNIAKSCMLNGASGPGWNDFLTTRTVRLNDLCMVGDNGDGGFFPAWVCSMDPFIVRDLVPSNDTYSITIAEMRANPDVAVTVRIPNPVQIQNGFSLPRWRGGFGVNTPCMSLQINPSGTDYSGVWNYAIITRLYVPNNARTVDVQIFPGVRGAPSVDQTVSIYAIKECNPAELVEVQARIRAAAAAAARAAAAAKRK